MVFIFKFQQFINEDLRNVNRQNNHGWTPLMYAAQAGNLSVCQLLLQFGACTQMQNEEGKSAVFLAQEWGHPITAIQPQIQREHVPYATLNNGTDGEFVN